MKKKLKKTLPKRIRIFVDYFLNNKFKSFSLRSQLIPAKQYSDFFIYMSNIYENSFIVENIFSLIQSEKHLVEHQINFYESNGELIHIEKYTSNNFIDHFKLPNLITDSKYISFTHQIKSLSKPSLDFNNFFKNNLLSFQHRGYSLIKKNKESLGSIVHGNSGAIDSAKDKKSELEIKKHYFRYTPVYKFEDDNEYDLVFNNPTNKVLKIKVILINKKNLIYNLSIKPFGSDYIEIINYEGMINFISKLPICRSIIFKNPNKKNNSFDVFHS